MERRRSTSSLPSRSDPGPQPIRETAEVAIDVGISTDVDSEDVATMSWEATLTGRVLGRVGKRASEIISDEGEEYSTNELEPLLVSEDPEPAAHIAADSLNAALAQDPEQDLGCCLEAVPSVVTVPPGPRPLQYNHGTRPWRNTSFLVLFAVALAVTIGVGLLAVASSNPDAFRAEDALAIADGPLVTGSGSRASAGTCVVPEPADHEPESRNSSASAGPAAAGGAGRRRSRYNSGRGRRRSDGRSLVTDARRWALAQLFNLEDTSGGGGGDDGSSVSRQGRHQEELLEKALAYSAAGTVALTIFSAAWVLLWLTRTHAAPGLTHASGTLLMALYFLANLTWYSMCLSPDACESINLQVRTGIFAVISLVTGFPLAHNIYLHRSAASKTAAAAAPVNQFTLDDLVIRTASESLLSNWTLLLIVPLVALALAVFSLALALLALFAFSNGELVMHMQQVAHDDHEAPRGGSTRSSVASTTSGCVWESHKWVPAYWTSVVVALYWTANFADQLGSYIIGGIVSQWYFAPAVPGMNNNLKATRITLGHACGPSLGTICLSSLVFAVVRPIRQTSLHMVAGGIVGFLTSCCFMVLIHWTLRTVENVTNFTIYFAAITGDDFSASTSGTCALLRKKELIQFAEGRPGNYTLTVVVFVSTAISFALVFVAVNGFTGLEASASVCIALLCALVHASIVGLLALSVGKVVDVLYVCYAMDKDAGRVSKANVHGVLAWCFTRAPVAPSVAGSASS